VASLGVVGAPPVIAETTYGSAPFRHIDGTSGPGGTAVAEGGLSTSLEAHDTHGGDVMTDATDRPARSGPAAGRHVLVGVDGSPSSLIAVDLAVREAIARQLSVRVVHADPLANPSRPIWGAPHDAGDVPPEPQRILRAALDRASAAGAGVPISGEILRGDPCAMLVHQSAMAELAAVGRRGTGGFPDLLLGSVAAKLAAHARCPVLVACGRSEPDRDVVVGVDGTAVNRAAVGYAVEEADLRGVELLAIHAVTGPQLAGPSGVFAHDCRCEEARAAALLADAVDDWHEQYPAVLIRRQARWAPAARVLVEASGSAQLVVVGARGASGLPGVRLGAVCHAVLHHAACPIAVVRGDRETVDGAPEIAQATRVPVSA
jgi:nucleotide-binding universal stress UspA family protein